MKTPQSVDVNSHMDTSHVRMHTWQTEPNEFFPLPPHKYSLQRGERQKERPPHLHVAQGHEKLHECVIVGMYEVCMMYV